MDTWDLFEERVHRIGPQRAKFDLCLLGSQATPFH